MKMHKQYRLRTIANPDGEIRWTIEMDPEFIDPVKRAHIFCPFKPGIIELVNIVTGGLEWNFSIVDLGSVLSQIEKIIRKAGLRDTK